MARLIVEVARDIRPGLPGIGVSGLIVGIALDLGAVVMFSLMSRDVGESVITLWCSMSRG